MSYPDNTSADSVAQDQIKAFVDRILRMREEARAINADIREIYAEAKGNGFDKTVLGKIVSYVEKRATKADALAEGEALFDLYLAAYDGLTAAEILGGPSRAHTHEAKSIQPETAAQTGSDATPDRAPADMAAIGPDHSPAGGEAVATPATKKRWTFTDKPHADCLDPERCGGFSNLGLCQRCKEAAA